MPQTASAKNALRVSVRRRAINDRWRARSRALERKLGTALAERNAASAQALSVELQSTLDRMARRHILHRNTAARVKSRLSAALRRAGAAGSSPTAA